jgi:hypothetical protein
MAPTQTPETTVRSEGIAELIRLFDELDASPPPTYLDDLPVLEEAFRTSEEAAADSADMTPDRTRAAKQYALEFFWLSLPW